MFPLDTAVIKHWYFNSQGRGVSVPGEEAGLCKDCLILWYTPANKLGNISTMIISSLKYLVYKVWLLKKYRDVFISQRYMIAGVCIQLQKSSQKKTNWRKKEWRIRKQTEIGIAPVFTEVKVSQTKLKIYFSEKEEMPAVVRTSLDVWLTWQRELLVKTWRRTDKLKVKSRLKERNSCTWNNRLKNSPMKCHENLFQQRSPRHWLKKCWSKG